MCEKLVPLFVTDTKPGDGLDIGFAEGERIELLGSVGCHIRVEITQCVTLGKDGGPAQPVQNCVDR